MKSPKPDISKRFALFAGDDYYPRGGVDDLQSTHDTLEEAVSEGKRRRSFDWFHVLDRETFKVEARVENEW